MSQWCIKLGISQIVAVKLHTPLCQTLLTLQSHVLMLQLF